MRLLKSKMIKFQFHYGSIKGLSQKRRWKHDSQFQFHYGSIKGQNYPVVRGY